MMKKIALAAGLAVAAIGVSLPASAHSYGHSYHGHAYHSYHSYHSYRPYYVYRHYAPVYAYSACHTYGWKIDHYGNKFWGCIW